MSNREEAIDILTRMSTNHFYGHREQEAFKLAVEALSAERWIPVTERLPEKEGQYLVSCDTDYGVEVGGFYIDEDGERYFGCDWNDPEDIVAWMPLPLPYRKGKPIITGEARRLPNGSIEVLTTTTVYPNNVCEEH